MIRTTHRDTLFFVHIPKTAGTSFRLAAIDAFGRDHCWFDYGAASKETSRAVLRHRYRSPDLHALGQAIDAEACAFLCGHVPAAKYAALVRSDRIISFVREPRAQLLSHYEHHVRHHGYRGKLGRFLASPAGGGVQTRNLAVLPLEAMGVIGVTERYEDSLRVLRTTYGAEFSFLKRNANPNKAETQAYPSPKGYEQALELAAAQDRCVHEAAHRLLDQRLEALDRGYAFVNGAIQNVTPTHVRGFAFDATADEPVTVELKINGRVFASAPAAEDRPGMRRSPLPRSGFIGYTFKLPTNLEDGDRIEVRVGATGQLLGTHAVETTARTAPATAEAR